MAGLTTEGFVPKRYQEILTELNDDLVNNLGVNIDTSVSSVAGVQNSILASQLASLWELAENVYDGSDLLKAEGEQLDNLALLQGIVRLPATPTRGVAWFRGDDGVRINTEIIISSLAGDLFEPEQTFTINTANCIETTFTVSLLVPETVYQVTVDSAIFTYLAKADDEISDVRDGLFNQLQLGSGKFTVSKVGADGVKISVDDKSIPLNISGTSYLSFSEVLTPAIIVSQEKTYVSGDAYSITNIDTPVNGWESVTNPTDLNLGRGEETDEELRDRILETYTTIGSGTPDTIVQRVLEVDNVQSAVMYENMEWAYDTNLIPNLPPKSYTVTVHDGLTEEIAQVIWETKPAGVQTVGNTPVEVTDRFGQRHNVYFSRPEIQYAWIKIYYTLYDEEEFPLDGESRMKEACLIYGDTLDINDDIIPKRFNSEIYQKVEGIDDLVVQIAITTDPLIDDPDDPSLTYQTARIPITATQVSTFGTARMNTYKDTTPP